MTLFGSVNWCKVRNIDLDKTTFGTRTVFPSWESFSPLLSFFNLPNYIKGGLSSLHSSNFATSFPKRVKNAMTKSFLKLLYSVNFHNSRSVYFLFPFQKKMPKNTFRNRDFRK